MRFFQASLNKGVEKQERQVAALQNVIQVQASEPDVINSRLRFHCEPEDRSHQVLQKTNFHLK